LAQKAEPGGADSPRLFPRDLLGKKRTLPRRLNKRYREPTILRRFVGDLKRKQVLTQWPKAPSFVGLRPASEASSRAMRSNRARNTRPEILLRKALRPYAFHYRLHDAALPGRPDLVFSSRRLAVFCDGDFWHGRHWARLRDQLTRRANADYWIAKIAANRDRDILQRRALERAGWVVLRVWESAIRRKPEAVAFQIATALEAARRTRSSREPQRVRHSNQRGRRERPTRPVRSDLNRR
jgi:DNA mismatch endonuclease (patch repair protein)